MSVLLRLARGAHHAIFGHGYGPCRDGKARCLYCGWVIQLYTPTYDVIPDPDAGFDDVGMPNRFKTVERLP